MEILSCEISVSEPSANKVPAKTIIDTGSGCNVINTSVATELNLKIDDIIQK